MRKQLINPPELYDGRPHGMSKAVIDTASATVYISGQVDWDMNHRVSCHTVEGQLKKALTNLTVVLDASGSSIENLLSLRIYVRGELGEFMGRSHRFSCNIWESRAQLLLASVLPHSPLQKHWLRLRQQQHLRDPPQSAKRRLSDAQHTRIRMLKTQCSLLTHAKLDEGAKHLEVE